jgi:hypothetical protein
LANVADYVRRGGAVLVASGPAFGGADSIARTPLNEILPAKPTGQVFERGFTPLISELGQRHPVTVGLDAFAISPEAEDGSPGWGRWFRLIDTEADKGDVIMTGLDEKPLLVLDRVGEGRIAMLLSDHAWLWSRGFEGGGPQLEFLRRLAHWTMKEPELEEERISAVVQGNKATIMLQSLADDRGPISLTRPDGIVAELETTDTAPGRWTAEFKGEANGIYRLEVDELKAVFAIGPSAPREFEKTIANVDVLQSILAATNGGVLRLEEFVAPRLRSVRSGRSASGRGWLGVTPRNAYLATDIRLTPILPAWTFMVLVAGLMLAAWRWEGR